LFAIVTVKKYPKLELSPQDQRTKKNQINIGKTANERPIRFFENERQEKPLFQFIKTTSHYAFRYSVEYFKSLSEEFGIPYQTLINLYLRDCAMSERKINIEWK